MPNISTISRARLTEDNPSILAVTSDVGLWMALSLLGLLLIFWLGLMYALFYVRSDIATSIIITVVFIPLAAFSVMFVATHVTFSLNSLDKTVTLTREYLWGFGPFPRLRRRQWIFSDIASVNHRTFIRTNNLELVTVSDDRIVLAFGNNLEDAARAAQVTANWLNIPEEAIAPQRIGSVPAVPADAVAYMYREIRSWASWSIVLGGLHLIASSTLNPAWGIVLIVVGLTSFYFREAAMFVIYGVTLGWVAISNLIGTGVGLWSAFALFQMYLSYRVFRQFFAFKKAQAALLPPQTESAPTRASRVFPWAGFALGVLAFNGVILAILGIFVAGIFRLQLITPITLVLEISVHLAILGVAVALAALLSGFKHKAFATVGLICGVLVVMAQVILILL